ncbi:MAG TPA: hypothetical protein ENK28_10690 [Aliiroseovarius sp.]|nr:hypothetical protein [Aliiroseovarius sp.]
MTLIGILVALATLIFVAALVEIWLKRGTKRPLSSHASNQRRWDDPNNPDRHDDKDHLITADRAMGAYGLSAKKQWRIPKDPQKQARMLMPEHAKHTQKDEDND